MNLSEQIKAFFIARRALLYIFVGIVVFIPVVLFLFSFFFSRQDGRASTATIVKNVSVSAVTPSDSSINVGIYPLIAVQFSRSLTQQEQGKVLVTTSPAITGERQWQPDQKTLIITPTERLTSDEKYLVSVRGIETPFRSSFTTVAERNISLEDLQKAQSIADKQYGEYWENVATNYPWYNKLPLRTQEHFVYFDTNRKVFVGKLYLSPSPTETVSGRVEQLKKEVLLALQRLGVSTSDYEFEWKVSLQNKN